MKVGLTGASGFLGSHLTSCLRENNHEVFSFEGDVSKFNDFNDFFSKENLDVLVHLAGISSVPEADSDTQKLFEVNTLGTANILESIKRTNPHALLVFASTAQIYNPPVDRSRITESHEIKPQNVYARSKLMSEKMIQAYCEGENMKSIVLRIFNHTHKSHSDRFFLPYVYKECLKAINEGRKSVSLSLGNIEVERDISPVQSFTYLVEKLISEKSSSRNFNVFNICGGQGFKLKDLLISLAKSMDLELDIKIDESKIRKGEPQYIAGDNSALFNFLNISGHNSNSLGQLITKFHL